MSVTIRLSLSDVSGNPHISYHDWANGDLKYAYIQGIESLNLSCEITADTLHLTWTASNLANSYWIYGAANVPWFIAGFSPEYQHRLVVLSSGTTTWISPNGIGDPDHNWTYLVIAVDETETELARSNRVGEHDFDTDIP